MANTKASYQVTITDITDTYSVTLSSEAYTFVGGTSGATSGTCSTDIIAMRGGTQITPTIQTSDISFSTANIIEVDSIDTTTNPTVPKVTFKIKSGATLSSAIEATMVVHVDTGVTINKKFSFAVAKTGSQGQQGQQGQQGPQGETGPQGPQGQQGPQGNAGADAILLSITTSAGQIFRNNTGTTNLIPEIFVGSAVATIGNLSSTSPKKYYPVTLSGNNIGYLYWYAIINGTETLLTTDNTGSADSKSKYITIYM